MASKFTRIFGRVAFCAGLALAGGCKSEADAALERFDDTQVVSEKHADSTARWMVTPEGHVWGRLERNGQPVSPSATQGKVVVQPAGAGAPVTKPLEVKGELLHAEVGTLEAPLTEVRYELAVEGKPVEGVLHLPKGGTAQLIANANVAAKAGIAAGTKGPHGGVVQVVDDHVLEVVGRKGSGEVRVYLLDDDKKAVAVGEEKLKLAVVDAGGKTEVVTLTPDDKKQYFTGKLDLRSNPHKLTVMVEDRSDVDIALVGYTPGVVLVAGAATAAVAIYVVDRWDVTVVDRSPDIYIIKGKGKGKWRGKGRSHRGVHINIH